MPRHHRAMIVRLLIFVLFSSLAFSSSICAQSPCQVGSRPSATLLFPYFEVEVFGSSDTLISIHNAAEEPALAHVVVWSKATVPVLDFTLHLEGRGGQSINLRHLLLGGRVPSTGADVDLSSFPSCSRPLTVPELDEAALTELFGQLIEAPPILPPPPVLKGFITVDVVNDCSSELHSPLDDGYFELGGTGLASNANLLWGDYFFLGGDSTSSAFGFQAVSVVADVSPFTKGLTESFYGNIASGRLPLPTGFRARYLRGNPGSRTELILWINPFDTVFGSFFSTLNFFDEKGRPAFGGADFHIEPTPFRIDLSGPEGLRAGSIELDVFEDECPVCSPPIISRRQAWLVPLYVAEGGLSVGLEAIPRSGFCE